MVQQWFTDAKLGIFIHWGLYAVKGVEESWSIFRGSMTYDDYMSQKTGFTAAHYDPEGWAEAIAGSGARYAVITSRHHEGLALWDSALSTLTAPRATPAGRDLLTPFCSAARARGLRLGIYYSLSDWSHPDYASVFHSEWGSRYNQGLGNDAAGDRFGVCYPRDGIEKPEAWKRYIAYMRGQLDELQNLYRPDLFWFDGDWERSAAQWGVDDIAKWLREENPNVMINSRLCKRGDYATPEQSVPFSSPRSAWETCMTINDSWGYRPDDRNFKSARRIIRTFTEVIAKGGNLLLDIGPRADGTLPQEDIEILAALGDWNHERGEAIFDSRSGMPAGHFAGPSTVSRDGRSLYLFVFDDPLDELAIYGLKNRVLSASTLGGPSSGRRLPATVSGGAPWYDIPGTLWIDASRMGWSAPGAVVKLELDGPLALYEDDTTPFGIASNATKG